MENELNNNLDTMRYTLNKMLNECADLHGLYMKTGDAIDRKFSDSLAQARAALIEASELAEQAKHSIERAKITARRGY